MTQPIRVIVEVSGGIVQAVYAGSRGAPPIEAVVVDHDSESVGEVPVDAVIDFPHADARGYDGGFPESWCDLFPSGA